MKYPAGCDVDSPRAIRRRRSRAAQGAGGGGGVGAAGAGAVPRDLLESPSLSQAPPSSPPPIQPWPRLADLDENLAQPEVVLIFHFIFIYFFKLIDFFNYIFF